MPVCSYCRGDERVERNTLEQRMEKIEDELEHGGKHYQEVQYNSKSLYTESVDSVANVLPWRLLGRVIVVVKLEANCVARS